MMIIMDLLSQNSYWSDSAQPPRICLNNKVCVMENHKLIVLRDIFVFLCFIFNLFSDKILGYFIPFALYCNSIEDNSR